MEETKNEKKRYWLKLDKNFLKSPQMKVIKSMPNGKDYIIFYLSLMLESIETVGHLRFTSLVPYNDDMLAAITDTNIDIVRSAVKVFCELGLMKIFDDGTIFLPNVPAMTGKESESAERVRNYRKRLQEKDTLLALHCNTDVTKCNDNKEKEKDKDKDKDKDKEIYKEIIDYLNLKLNSNYKSSSKNTQKHINARLEDGFTLEDFKKVIDKKYKEWFNNPEMRQYLRPETLFGTKFEGYLNAPEKQNINQSNSKYTKEELDKLLPTKKTTDEEYRQMEEMIAKGEIL